MAFRKLISVKDSSNKPSSRSSSANNSNINSTSTSITSKPNSANKANSNDKHNNTNPTNDTPSSHSTLAHSGSSRSLGFFNRRRLSSFSKKSSSSNIKDYNNEISTNVTNSSNTKQNKSAFSHEIGNANGSNGNTSNENTSNNSSGTKHFKGNNSIQCETNSTTSPSFATSQQIQQQTEFAEDSNNLSSNGKSPRPNLGPSSSSLRQNQLKNQLDKKDNEDANDILCNEQDNLLSDKSSMIGNTSANKINGDIDNSNANYFLDHNEVHQHIDNETIHDYEANPFDKSSDSTPIRQRIKTNAPFSDDEDEKNFSGNHFYGNFNNHHNDDNEDNAFLDAQETTEDSYASDVAASFDNNHSQNQEDQKPLQLNFDQGQNTYDGNTHSNSTHSYYNNGLAGIDHDQDSRLTISSNATTTAATATLPGAESASKQQQQQSNDVQPKIIDRSAQHQSQKPRTPQLSEPFLPTSKSDSSAINMNGGDNIGGVANTAIMVNTSDEIEFNLPFGDGALKIFGMENFGASCYCNSIVQSLFYTQSFRKFILSLPTELRLEEEQEKEGQPRKPKLQINGKKPHHFLAALQNSKNENGNSNTEANGSANDLKRKSNGSDVTNNDNDASNNNNSNNNNNEGTNNGGGIKLGRRMSFFGKKDKNKDYNNNDNGNINSSHNNSVGSNSSNGYSRQNSVATGVSSTTITNGPHHDFSNNKDNNNNSNTSNVNGNGNSGSSHHSSQLAYRAKSNYLGLRDLKLGFDVPNRNITVVGVVDDVNSTTEQRKRKALISGPILNIDHALTNDETMFNALKDIFECMVEHESQIGVVSPSHLLEVLKKENELFRSMMHQDAHEFFNFLLNSVFEAIDKYHNDKKEHISVATKKLNGNDNGSGNGSADIQQKLIALAKLQRQIDWSNELFEGLLTSQTKCLRCENISSRDEKFLDLSIDLENNTSITACLKQFSANEILCEDNKFYCENCSALQEATKRMVVKKLPKILTLHLKRFKYSEALNRNIKLFHRVSYPLYLRLFNTLATTVRQDRVYELYSVVVHIGGGPYHGHYVSLVKTEHSGWLLFDDETVESIDENFVLRFFGDGPGLASAYILFYQEISEEEYLKKTLYKNTLDLSLDFENEIEAEIAKDEQSVNSNNTNNNAGFHIPDYKRKSSVVESINSNASSNIAPSENYLSRQRSPNNFNYNQRLKSGRSYSSVSQRPSFSSIGGSNSNGNGNGNSGSNIFGSNTSGVRKYSVPNIAFGNNANANNNKDNDNTNPAAGKQVLFSSRPTSSSSAATTSPTTNAGVLNNDVSNLNVNANASTDLDTNVTSEYRRAGSASGNINGGLGLNSKTETISEHVFSEGDGEGEDENEPEEPPSSAETGFITAANTNTDTRMAGKLFKSRSFSRSNFGALKSAVESPGNTASNKEKQKTHSETVPETVTSSLRNKSDHIAGASRNEQASSSPPPAAQAAATSTSHANDLAAESKKKPVLKSKHSTGLGKSKVKKQNIHDNQSSGSSFDTNIVVGDNGNEQGNENDNGLITQDGKAKERRKSIFGFSKKNKSTKK